MINKIEIKKFYVVLRIGIARTLLKFTFDERGL